MNTILKYAVALPAGLMLMSGAALARPGHTAADLHLRAAPGVGSAVITTMPAFAHVRVGRCVRDGTWCRVRYRGMAGWASAAYLRHRWRGWEVGEAPAAYPDMTPSPFGVVGAVVAAPFNLLGAIFSPAAYAVPASPHEGAVAYGHMPT